MPAVNPPWNTTQHGVLQQRRPSWIPHVNSNTMVPFQWTSELETREPSSWAFASSSLSSPHLNHPHLSLYPSYSRAEIIRRTRYTQNPLSTVRANKDSGSIHKRPIKTSSDSKQEKGQQETVVVRRKIACRDVMCVWVFFCGRWWHL